MATGFGSSTDDKTTNVRGHQEALLMFTCTPPPPYQPPGGVTSPPPYRPQGGVDHVERVVITRVRRLHVSLPGSPTMPSRPFPASETVMNKEEFIRDKCKVLDNSDMKIYTPKMDLNFEDKGNWLRKFSIGQKAHGVPEKVIMMVGATGSGKSTSIDGIFNYILGVEWNDKYRMKLVVENLKANQAESQTKWITSYTIHHQPWFTVPYTLTIIDTPGFGDTSGIERDQKITAQIRACFQKKGPDGVAHIDAVCFVAQSALPRLTPSQKYIFESVLSLFGKDIADNIILMLTFSDGQKPQVLAAITEAKVPYKKFYKFNNSALFAKAKDEDEFDTDENFDEMFWKMGKKNFKVFLSELGKLKAKSLVLTKKVLEERQRLEIIIEGIQVDVKMGLNKLEQLLTECKVLDSHQADVDANINFTYTVQDQRVETVPTQPGQYTTNCIVCNRTCHKDCAYANDEDKINCWAMTDEKCRICPRKCKWDLHKNQPYVYVIKIVTVTKTYKDIKQRYQLAKDEKVTSAQMVQKCQDDFQKVQLRVLQMIDEARKIIARLNQIALRTDPLSTVDYIDVLIQGEKADAKPGWKERVEQLMNVKEKAKQMQELAKTSYDPFGEMKKQYDDERLKHEQDLRKRLNLI